LQSGAALAASSLVPRTSTAAGAFNPWPDAWRTFEVVTKVEVARSLGAVQVWIPIPSVNEEAWFRSHESVWTANARSAALVRDPTSGAGTVHAQWKDGETAPVVEVASRFSTRDRAIDLSDARSGSMLSESERKRYSSGTEMIPIDGIVRETADKIVGGAKTDFEKARAIYDWIVDNTFRDPKTRGCGIGDIASMLRTGNLGGKCADINALLVGLARASGITARDVYGIRVAPSKLGYRSLGANSEVITKAQHCRAEVHLAGYGWMAIDPADVRKVILEEPPGYLSVTDTRVADARRTLFGAWEGNWLAYNVGGEIALPGTTGPRLNFLMYPQAEVAGARLDCLDPDNLRYTITARELTAT